ncbi:MAG: hypothetical protein VZQ83_08025 [Eubacterium sp.]|nr:hypothetical protein [Eubacterium sp.]
MFLRKLTGLLCIISIAFCLVACGEETPQSPTPEATEETVVTPSAVSQMETITVFTIDASTMSILPSRVKKNENDDSLQYLVELVLDNLEDDKIGISSVEQEGDKAIIYFDSNKKPVSDCDEEMEDLILECFANSILDNAEGVHGVIFRTDKGNYVSAYKTMKEDEVYASR